MSRVFELPGGDPGKEALRGASSAGAGAAAAGGGVRELLRPGGQEGAAPGTLRYRRGGGDIV